ncbi:MAG TPA: hypothetical protein VNO43_13330 [Candidatus Eisenbacteria bacterium]|nr:hypothetical protein [Candidatus Eisenbacteria bacterium]
MPVDLKSAVTRNIAEIKKTLSQKTAELEALQRDLERQEAVRRMLSGDRPAVRRAAKKGRKRSATDWNEVLRGLPATFTAQDFSKAAGGRNRSAVYLRQILSRLTKRRRLKRIARGRYRKV